jgi:hypothetical protein
MSVVLVPARMPAHSGRHMAALVPLKGLGCLETVEGDVQCTTDGLWRRRAQLASRPPTLHIHPADHLSCATVFQSWVQPRVWVFGGSKFSYLYLYPWLYTCETHGYTHTHAIHHEAVADLTDEVASDGIWYPQGATHLWGVLCLHGGIAVAS